MKKNKNTLNIYLKYIAASVLLIGTVASLQHMVHFGELRPEYYILPFMVALVIGSLLGRAAVLKEQLAYKSEQFRAIADLAMEFTYYRLMDGSYEYVSPYCLDITGYTQDEFYAQPDLMDEVVYKDDREQWLNHEHRINGAHKLETLDIRLISRTGKLVWISHLCSPVYDEQGEQIGVRSTNMDITERKSFEERYRQMALFDPLTNLPNRRLLEKELHEYIANTSPDDVFALFFLDLSRFKNINDNFGHTFGDRLLRSIAERLEHVDKQLFVSRFGGDEFVFFSPLVTTNEEAIRQAEAILEVIEQPLCLDDVELFISGSIGIAFYPRDGEDVETLISRADAAMYDTKGEGDVVAKIYSASMSDQVKHFVLTENNIHKGLDNNEFELYYQPKVDIETGLIIGVEGLIRWNNPEQGMINPGEFIHIAEETGQIIDIGNLVLEQAIEDVHRWDAQGIAVPVAINVSARQFASQAHCDHCRTRLMNMDIDQSMIELEVTEQVLLGNVERACNILQSFRDIGVSIALDDFGTGYSSLNYLKKLPIDTLKIDISFIRDLVADNRAYNILKAILMMSHDLGLKTVAEGVETEEQKALLKELNCNIVQGFLLYRPMPVQELEALLKAQLASK